MKLLAKYKNGDVNVLLFEDGTKIRSSKEENPKVEFPESMDIKITDYCDRNCPYCHEKSTTKGIHGDLNSKFFNTLPSGIELACLTGDNVVISKYGAKDIKELKIGDEIYDSEHKLRKVIQIKESYKPIIKLKGNKGQKIQCTKDHIFISDNKEIEAEKTNGTFLDTVKYSDEDITEEIIIDMAKYIKNRTIGLKGSVGGAIIDDNKVRLSNSTKKINRYIKLSKEIMWLYGLFVSQGSTKGVTINKNNKWQVEKIKDALLQISENPRIYENYHKNDNGLSVEFLFSNFIESFFVKELKVGKGAKNKNISFLLKLKDKELIKKALQGLYNGDGSFRKRGTNFLSTTFKTSSKKMAYELAYILKRDFDILSSIHKGISPLRTIENRTLNESIYYQVEFYGMENCKKIFKEDFERKFGENVFNTPTNDTKKNSLTKQKIKISNIEEIKNKEKVYDITLDNGTHIFPINGYVLTHNCGGGNPLSHPGLIEFLKKMKEKNIFPNMTIHQEHLLEYWETVKMLDVEKLVRGIGISITNPTDEVLGKIKELNNPVLHVINGIVTKEQLKKMYDKNLKLLILGYKSYTGRGETYYQVHSQEILNKFISKETLIEMNKHFSVLSFDNLALAQIPVREVVGEKIWSKSFMGEDGNHTMYIDLVKQEFARTSTSKERFELKDNIKDMFNVVKI